ncbi:MAG TPA: CBS domain-containing protein [Candidatus Bathyarchaeia archaeon]|nr:CBS domain-containing protein [Candidatus Bathyarchaeia archaeon]
MANSKITSVGQIMTEGPETVGLSSSIQQASTKMRDKNVSSLVVIDEYNKPVGIVTERDFVRKVYVNDSSHRGDMLMKDIMSSPLITINTMTSVEEAADLMIQNKVRHLLVVENDDTKRPLGIITATDFVAYLKENLNMDDVSAKILAFIEQHKDDKVIEELEEEGELPKDVQEGGEEYENEEPRQGV